MAYKYDKDKVRDLLDGYLNLIKDEVKGDMVVTGGGDCPWVWIEIALDTTFDKVKEEDLICFFIDGETDTGKFYHQEQFEDNKVTWLECKKTNKAVKKFMLEIIKNWRNKNG